MNRFPVRFSLTVLATGLVALLAAGCGSSGDGAAGAKKMAFKLTDAGCDPHDAKTPAGPTTFEVENAGSSSVTELEVLDGDTILGELENLSEGLSGSFSLTLEEGEYTLRCKGGEEEDGTLTVTGGATARRSPEVKSAVAQYREYLEKNTAELTAATTEPFVTAVESGEVDEAKTLYAAARIPSSGSSRWGVLRWPRRPRHDVPQKEFGGFHRIEKALWVKTRPTA